MGLKKPTGQRQYSGFRKIDGQHPFRTAVPQGVVDYQVRTRHGGEVFYFNFDLAKEMGLIPMAHPREMNADLRDELLHAFALEIINEYDIIHQTPIPEDQIRPHQYMATRYLQLQHPGRTGQTSGDGRSIWNGYFKGKDATWDISSCGTGATCLSPAVAIEKSFFKTGDKNVSYGSGRSDMLDGVCAAIMSEILFRNGFATERTLAVVVFDDDTSINVRVAKNLLRPAHFFGHLKQSNYDALKGSIDFYIQRQIDNKEWPAFKKQKERYEYLLGWVASVFAEAAAHFELEYIFCWMDWDGDNILVDAGIIDYGSVRQFGLYHHEYRYDDVDRMSTTITGQKNKAKYIVQTFAQLCDFLITGEKKNLHLFRRHSALRQFDKIYNNAKDERLLYKIGFEPSLGKIMFKDAEGRNLLHQFMGCYSYFEKAKSVKGLYQINDGVTWDAIFCIRDVMRELPCRYLEHDELISGKAFMDLLKSNYATQKDLQLTPGRKRKIKQFQQLYQQLVARAAKLSKQSKEQVLESIVKRSALINRYERVTGDAIIYLSEALVDGRKKMTSKSMHKMFSDFVNQQVLRPEYFSGQDPDDVSFASRNAKEVYANMLEIVRDYREGI